MSDLVAFLNARLDEDEAVAKEAAGPTGGRWLLTDDSHIVRRADTPGKGPVAGGLYDLLRPAYGAHIARHDPARALRDVEVKRKMLAELTRWPYDYRPECDDATRLFVRLLGAVYSDHPDYDPAWADASH